MASKLYQVFTGVPNQKYCLIKARIVAKNGQLSDWTAWHYALAGDSTAPVVPTGAEVNFTAPIGAMFFRLTDAYIAGMDVDIVRFRWYVQSRSGSGVLAFDSSWTPTAVLDRDTYTFTYSLAYAAATYYHIWCVPEDVMGNWDSTPGAAQEQNKQPGYVATTDVPVSSLGWTYGGAFTASDLNTIAWAAGTLTLADGNAYSITGSNTGDISAVTFIYWDKDVSTTAFQTTTVAATSVGTNKLLVAVGQNVVAGKLAVFQAFNAKGGGVLITADNITAGTITGNEVAANTIAAGNLTVGTLSAITANMGTLTAGTITGGKYNTAASGARVQLFPDANTGIVAYDDGGGSEKKVLEVLVAGTDVGDVTIGDTTGQYLKFDKSAGDILCNVEDFYVKGGSSSWARITHGALGYTNYGLFAIEDANNGNSLIVGLSGLDLGPFHTGQLQLYNITTAAGVSGNYVILGSAGDSGDPALILYENISTYTARLEMGSDGVLRLNSGSGTLYLLSGGDILIDPAGGDVDFDACDIWLDSGKHLSLNGSTDTIYIAYDSANTEILCSSRVNATGGFADNGTDGIDWTGNPNSLTSMTFLGGILTATA